MNNQEITFCLYFEEIVVLILGDIPKRFSKHCRVCHSLAVSLLSWRPGCLGSREANALSQNTLMTSLKFPAMNVS